MSRLLALGLVLQVGTGSILYGDGPDQESSSSSRYGSVQDVLRDESKGVPLNRSSLLASILSHNEDASKRAVSVLSWQSGLIQLEKDWKSVEEITEEDLKSSLRKYRKQRGDQVLDLEGHRSMALYCTSQNWLPQAKAHWYGVLSFQPNHVEARKALGFRRIGNRWVSTEEWQSILDQNSETLASLKKWYPRVSEVASQIDRGGKETVKAIEWLQKVEDPGVVPALHAVAVRNSGDTAVHLVNTIRRFQTKEACSALADLAIAEPSSPTSGSAIKGLKEVESEWYVPELLDLMASDIEVQNQIVTRPNGALVLQTIGQQELQNTNEVIQIDKILTAGSGPNIAPRMAATNRRLGLRSGRNVASIQSPTNAVAASIAMDEAERFAKANTAAAANSNAELREKQSKIAVVLRATSGQKLDDSAQTWWNWWQKQQEIEVLGPKEINYQYGQDYSSPVYTPRPVQVSFTLPENTCECLVAGTTVQTETGLASIESIRIGDQVVSQNILTGELCLKPVIRTTRREPAPTRSMTLESGESIVSTLGHPWWVTGKGWIKTKDLQPGMAIRTTSGNVLIKEVSSAKEEVTYNLVVADNHNYFVGEKRLLSFDAGELIPTFQKAPGLPAEPVKPHLASR
ncbi:polymorphic toxin-type HINT domain-containing protein [Pirellula sp. SH-Sr6A]|uniref:polymorphic toxin-type HINT domain-containing protein n=1 Tax=Pirellula sp. SH-Sr6A TaxID=1632865 RepID=UPI00197B32E0|nr:polymorphic toxin-type HINT domain-containing protein [Pirellula sp. SH-Sr6A]